MDNDLSYQIEKNGREITLKLEGRVSEMFPSEVICRELENEIKGVGKITLDCFAVKEVNSTGVNDWIPFIDFLVSNTKSLEFVNCSPAIIQQVNMIPRFLGAGKITSFFAPYTCDSCGKSKLEPVKTADLMEIDLDEFVKCCGAYMELDELKDEFLAFYGR